MILLLMFTIIERKTTNGQLNSFETFFSDNYGLKESYEKEKKLQMAQRQNEEMALFGFFPAEG